MGVHGCALLDGESLKLSQACVHEDGTKYDGEHANYNLCFFDLCNCAQAPRSWTTANHCCPVQESNQKKKTKYAEINYCNFAFIVKKSV